MKTRQYLEFFLLAAAAVGAWQTLAPYVRKWAGKELDLGPTQEELLASIDRRLAQMNGES